MNAALTIAIFIWVGQTPPPPAPGDSKPESVDVRYARAQLQLAEANLRRVEQSNKKLPRSIPSSVVSEYQREVQVAKTRLDQATAGKAASDFQIWLQRADAEQKSAETSWKNAAAVNARAAGTFDPLDIERFRLRSEVAKLQLERGQALVDAGHEAQMQWEMDLLDNQVQRLKEESGRASPFIRLYPYWWW